MKNVLSPLSKSVLIPLELSIFIFKRKLMDQVQHGRKNGTYNENS